MKVFSRYNLIARIFPTIIGLIPIFIFQYFYLNNIWSIDSLIASAVGNFGLSTILLYAFNQYFVRIPSKIFEDFLFGKQLYFPTTSFLLYSDGEYSKELKDKMRKSVNSDFSIQLPTAEDEKKNEEDARRRIKDVIRLIIGRVKDGHLVRQHNIEYGFVRNLWGASFVGVFGSVILMDISATTSLVHMLGKVFLVAFCTYLALGFLLIQYLGRAYARKLIDEYLSTSHEN